MRLLSSSFARRVVVGALIAITAPSLGHAQAGVTRCDVAQLPTPHVSLDDATRRQYGSAPLIAGQIVGGSLAAAGAGFAAWAMYDSPNGPDRRVKGDEGYTPAANTAFALGSFAGAVAATHLIGRIDGSKSKLLGTVIGAAIPTIPLLFGRNDPYLPLYGIVFGAPLQAIGGMLGEQLSRHGP
jgi:hypothetical protein